jgi:TPR repeat protein
MANCYYNGEGVKENFEEGEIWLKKATEKKNKMDQMNLNFCFKILKIG